METGCGEFMFQDMNRGSKVEKLLKEADEYARSGVPNLVIQKLEAAQRWLRASKSDEKLKEVTLRINEEANSLAMVHLQKNEPEECFELLRKAQKNAMESNFHQTLTLNNLACYYRARKKERVSLKLLQQALDLAADSRGRFIADLLLNICAIQSKMGRHREAQLSALKALSHLHTEIFDLTFPFFSEAMALREGPADPPDPGRPGDRPQSPRESPGSLRFASFTRIEDRVEIPREGQRKEILDKMYDIISAYCVALHNLAVELEFLEDFKNSLNTYRRSHQTAAALLGENSEVAISLKRVADNANFAISAKLKHLEERKAKQKVPSKFRIPTREKKTTVSTPQPDKTDIDFLVELRDLEDDFPQPFRKQKADHREKTPRIREIAACGNFLQGKQLDTSGKLDQRRKSFKDSRSNMSDSFNMKIKSTYRPSLNPNLEKGPKAAIFDSILPKNEFSQKSLSSNQNLSHRHRHNAPHCFSLNDSDEPPKSLEVLKAKVRKPFQYSNEFNSFSSAKSKHMLNGNLFRTHTQVIEPETKHLRRISIEHKEPNWERLLTVECFKY